MIIYNIYKTIIIIIPPISVVVFLKRLLDGYFFKLPKYFQDSWRTSWCNLCNKKKKPPVSRSLYKYKNYEWFFIITSIVYPLNSSEYTLQYIYRYIKEGNFWKSYNNVNSIYAHVLFGSWTFYSCFYIRIHTLTHTPIVVYLYIHTLIPNIQVFLKFFDQIARVRQYYVIDVFIDSFLSQTKPRWPAQKSIIGYVNTKYFFSLKIHHYSLVYEEYFYKD